jgi:hypothetical protein
MASESDSIFEIVSEQEEADVNAEDAAQEAKRALTRTSPLALSINAVLVEAAGEEGTATALMQKKKKAKKTAAKYVVKLAANANNADAGEMASTDLMFKITAIANTIARICKLGIGKEFADDMIDLKAHTLIGDLMRRRSLSQAVSTQTACCHALANMLDLTVIDTPARTERQVEFLNVNIHISVTTCLASESLCRHRDCVVESMRLCSLLAEKNKLGAKRLRKCGVVTSLQNILVEYSTGMDHYSKVTKIVVLKPAKKTLQDCWYGSKKKRTRK